MRLPLSYRATKRPLRTVLAVGGISLFFTGTAGQAQEIWGGVFAHAVETPLTFATDEGGVDVQLGYRGAPLEGLRAIGAPSPYAIASLNTRGDTSFAGGGLSWTLRRGAVYLRPGLGIIVHDGPRRRVNQDEVRTDLGSRVLFEPELGLGLRVSPRLSVEANWTHISHAQIFGGQNPGIDMIGLRINWRLR